MAVKEAQRKVAEVIEDARDRASESLARAGKAATGGLETARAKAGRATGKATPRLRAVGEAATERLQAAQAKADKGLQAGREKAGRKLRRTRRKVGYWVAGEKPKSRTRRIGTGLMAGAAGAAAAFFLDPVSGKRRRRLAKDWATARIRGLARRGNAARRFAAARASGAIQGIRHRRDGAIPENDQVLAHKVESELFQDIDISSGRIVINAERGTVVLRGQVDRTDDIRRIEDRVRRIAGVGEVENLLHLPGQPAPTSR
jgi:ElaB/YqjD/DUF883 family membrane-anchored ribosome-binding protein